MFPSYIPAFFDLAVPNAKRGVDMAAGEYALLCTFLCGRVCTSPQNICAEIFISNKDEEIPVKALDKVQAYI